MTNQTTSGAPQGLAEQLRDIQLAHFDRLLAAGDPAFENCPYELEFAIEAVKAIRSGARFVYLNGQGSGDRGDIDNRLLVASGGEVLESRISKHLEEMVDENCPVGHDWYNNEGGDFFAILDLWTGCWHNGGHDNTVVDQDNRDFPELLEVVLPDAPEGDSDASIPVSPESFAHLKFLLDGTEAAFELNRGGDLDLESTVEDRSGYWVPLTPEAEWVIREEVFGALGEPNGDNWWSVNLCLDFGASGPDRLVFNVAGQGNSIESEAADDDSGEIADYRDPQAELPATLQAYLAAEVYDILAHRAVALNDSYC